MKLKTIAAPFAGLLLGGCPAVYTGHSEITSIKPLEPESGQFRHDLMVGLWYGRQRTNDAKVRQWWIHRFADGTYEARFHLLTIQDECTRLEWEQREFGRWGVSGSIYFSTLLGFRDKDGNVLPEQPSYPHGHDAYRILNLTQDTFSYEHVETGNRYTVNRAVHNSDLNAYDGMTCDG
jgi:hypothetical protein